MLNFILSFLGNTIEVILFGTENRKINSFIDFYEYEEEWLGI